MTLETLTRPDLQTQTESRPAGEAAPIQALTPVREAASPQPFAEPTLSVLPEMKPARRGGGHMNRATPSRTAAANPSARQTGPDAPMTTASNGSAQTRPANRRSLGAPTLSEPAIVELNPIRAMPAHGGDQCDPDTQSRSVPATPSDPANPRAETFKVLPGPGDGLRNSETPTCGAVAKPSRRAKQAPAPIVAVPGGGDGQVEDVTQPPSAVATPSDPALDRLTPIVAALGRGDGPSSTDTHRADAIATIVDLWRQRIDLRRAEGRLNLQALAVCRRACGNDKEAGQKAWAAIQKGKTADPELALVVEPYRLAMATLDVSASGLEKQLAKLVRPLPLWSWAKDVRGLGELTVAGLIGESAGPPGAYKSVSALWKRFGLAVIDGGRQRRVAGAEDALRHGYAPQRRAFAYVISTQLMRSQRDGDPYRALYDRRKAYELEREIPKAHAHNRALRVMVKELLKHAWVADRRGASE